MHDRSKPHRLAGLLASALLLPGCSASDVGGEIRVHVARQHALSSEQLTAGPVHLPGDRGFNIHVKKSSRNPGPDGGATSDSDATADGRALCLAQAADGGSASADFHLGHRFVNRTGSPQSVQIEVEYELDQAIEASPVPTARTLATADMDLVVVDSRKRSIAKMGVVHATSDEAAATLSSRDRRTLTLRFEPGRWYDVILFGQVHADADEGQKARARLDVGQLKMHLSFSPAATQPAEQAKSTS